MWRWGRGWRRQRHLAWHPRRHWRQSWRRGGREVFAPSIGPILRRAASDVCDLAQRRGENGEQHDRDDHRDNEATRAAGAHLKHLIVREPTRMGGDAGSAILAMCRQIDGESPRAAAFLDADSWRLLTQVGLGGGGEEPGALL